MTGVEVNNLDIPIGKNSTALLALSHQEISSTKRSVCIRCARCIDVCPEGLEPQFLYELATHVPQKSFLIKELEKCTDCGLCGYICPSRLPLPETFLQIKTALCKEVLS
jgi:electron transport complex protein RnfC